MDNKRMLPTSFDEIEVDGYYPYRSTMRSRLAAPTSHGHELEPSGPDRGFLANDRNPYAHLIMNDLQHSNELRNAPPPHPWNRGARRSLKSKRADNLDFSPNLDRFNFFHGVDNGEASGTWQNNDIAATSSAQPHSGRPIYTLDTAPGVSVPTGSHFGSISGPPAADPYFHLFSAAMRRMKEFPNKRAEMAKELKRRFPERFGQHSQNNPYIGPQPRGYETNARHDNMPVWNARGLTTDVSESGPPPPTPIIRGTSPPPGVIGHFGSLDKDTDMLDKTKCDTQEKLDKHGQWNAPSPVAQPQSEADFGRYGGVHDWTPNDWSTMNQAIEAHAALVTEARREKQPQVVDETTNCGASSVAASSAPIEITGRSSPETVMPDMESSDGRQSPLPDAHVTARQPALNRTSNSPPHDRVSPVAKELPVRGTEDFIDHVFMQINNERMRASNAEQKEVLCRDYGYQPYNEKIGSAFGQDDEQMNASDFTSVVDQKDTHSSIGPYTPSIASTVDVGSAVRDAIQQAEQQAQAQQAQAHAQVPALTLPTQSANFTEEVLQALIFEPNGDDYYDWSNEPGWAVTAESLPEVTCAHRLDRLMGDHGLGAAIAEAMLDEFDGSDKKWVVRAVFPFGENGAMVVVRKG